MPVVVTPAAFTQPCAEMWVDPTLLAGEFVDTPYETLVQIAVDVTWLLWRLSGERFHGTQCVVEDYDITRGNGCRLDLRQWPVQEIIDVSFVDICANNVVTTGIGTPATGWCRERDTLRLCCGVGGTYGSFFDWRTNSTCNCTGNNTVRVRYVIGNNVPPGAERAAYRLGTEYVKSFHGKPCSLPERITTVTRQGVTWTVLDPQDFLQNGLLGFAPADQWLSAVNGKGWAKLQDPLTMHHLLNSTIVGCGKDCFEVFA